MSATVSNTEKRIVSSCLLNPTAYNIPLFIRFEEGLDIPKMYNLLTRYLEQFDIFRTSYVINDGIRKTKSDTLPIIQVRTFKQFDKDLLLKEQMITLSDNELVRLVLCRVQDQVHDYMFINVHHVLLDGFSMNLFLQELVEAYLSEQPAVSKLCPPRPEDCGEAAAARESDSTISFESYGPFKTKLMSRHVDKVHYLNDRFILKTTTAKRHSDFAVALTAFSISMAHWLGTGTVYMAYPYLGRDPRNYRALGNFVQLIPFFREFENELDTRTDELISRIQTCIFSSFAGHDYFDELIHKEKMNSMSIFRDIIFDYKSGSLIAKTLSQAQGIRLEEASAYQDEKYGLHFSVYRNGDELELSVISSEYDLDDLQTLLTLFQSNICALYDNERGELCLRDLLTLEVKIQEQESDKLPKAQAGKVYAEVASMVSSLLEGDADVGADISFFDLGMDSLLLVKFKKKIRETFNINLKISDFFNYHTTELLSVKIMDHLKEAN